jgi:RNA polymerase sigma-70 factor, ECF subfamily
MEGSGALLSECFPSRMENSEKWKSAQPDVSWPQSVREFEALVDRLQDRLVQFAWWRLGNRADAEDVVQEVLVQAYRDREKHRSIADAEPYIFRMVANRSTDLVRRRKRESGPPGDLWAAPPGGSGEADTAERMRAIDGLLARLPARQAEAIRLRVYADLPFDAVAKAMGCSVPTVKSRFRYGIEKLRGFLKRSGGER